MADNENAFVFFFPVHTADGIAGNLTIRGSDMANFMDNIKEAEKAFPNLGTLSLLMREAPSGSARPREYRVTRWMRGETKSERSGPIPAVFLYADNPSFNYSLVTVYQEDLDKLPPEIDWQNAPSVGNGAPPVARLANDDRVRYCDITVVLAPKFDFEGKLVKKDNGDPVMRFSHVVGYDPKAGASPQPQQPQHRSATTTTPPPTEMRESPPPARTSGPAVNNSGAPCPICHAPNGKAHASNCSVGKAEQKQADKDEQKRMEQYGKAPETERPKYTSDDPKSIFEDDKLMPYARGYNDPNIVLSPDTSLILRNWRDMHKTSAKRMSISYETPTGEKKRGQYNFLAGLIDQIADKVVGIKSFHGEVLSFICGDTIRAETPPGDKMRDMLDKLTYRSNGVDNPNFDRNAYNAVIEIIKVCKDIAAHVATEAELPEMEP